LTDSQRKQPISRHPLFPATVALWFGAIFGLGSMAIRASLVEQAILALGLHTIIPSISPPLGATAQLLIALGAAMIGGILGASLARRIGLPQQAQRERRRGAQSVVDGNALEAGRLKDGGTPPDTGEGSAGAANSRKRHSASQDTAFARGNVEPVPLPGGSPKVFNVSEFNLEGFEEIEHEPEQEFNAKRRRLSNSRDEQVEFDEEARDAEETRAQFEDCESEKQGADEAIQSFIASDRDAPFGPPPDSISEGEFNSLEETTENFPLAQDLSLAGVPDAAGNAEKQVAEEGRGPRPFLTSQDSATEANFNRGGLSPCNINLCDEVGDHAGQEASTFDASETNLPSSQSSDLTSIAERDDKTTGAIGEQQAENSDVTGQSSQCGDDVFAPTADTDSSRLLSTSLNELSHTELLERLAMSLNRRQDGEQTGDAAVAKNGCAVELGKAKGDFVPEFSVHVAANDLRDAVADEITSDPVSLQNSEEAVDDQDRHIVLPPVPTIPAALRPISLDDDGDTELLPANVPPRHFSMTSRPVGTEILDDEQPSGDLEPAEKERTHCLQADDGAETQQDPNPDKEREDDDLAGEDIELEEGYSSLLKMSRTDHQQFVRIEEPEAGDEEIKPFVVFPNGDEDQAAPFSRPQTGLEYQQAAASSDSVAPPPTSESDERRFDGPKTDKESAAASVALDPEETERSLRAALATLQRMSGAA